LGTAVDSRWIDTRAPRAACSLRLIATEFMLGCELTRSAKSSR
jgi:hypothetical protein